MTFPRGIAYHEAGHAVVGWALGVKVAACRVFNDEAKGWKGGTDASVDQVSKLPLSKRIAFYAAGYTAEKVFQCSIDHDRAADGDNEQIYLALKADRIAEVDHKALIDQGNSIARAQLEAHRTLAVALAEHLVECGRVDDASEFLQSMQ